MSIKRITLISCLLFFVAFSVSAQTEEERLRILIEQLGQEKLRIEGIIAKTAEQANTLKNQIANLKNQIASSQVQISLTSKKIDKTKIEINDTQNNIFSTQEKIDKQKNTIGQLILFMDRRDKDNLLGIMLKNNDLSDYFRQIQSAMTVNANLVDVVQELQSTEDQLIQSKSSLEEKKSSLESLKQQQNNQKISLSGTKSEKDGLLKQTEGKEATYQKMLAEVERKQSLFFTELKELETKIIQGGLYILHVKAQNLPKKGTNIFQWPEDSYRTTQAYGMTTYARRGAYGGKIHNGMDIKVRYGAPVKSIGDGGVYIILLMLVLQLPNTPIRWIYIILLGVGLVGNLNYLFNRWFK